MLGNFIKGLVFGSVVGAAGGLLAAPRSGDETRQKLAAELEDAAETTLELNASLNRFKEAVATTKATAEETIPVLQSAMKLDLEAYKFQAEPRIKQIKEQVAVINQHVEELSGDTASTNHTETSDL